MPKNWYRTEIRFSPVNRSKLERLRKEIFEQTGKKVSMTKLVDKVVETYFEKVESYPFTFPKGSSR